MPALQALEACWTHAKHDSSFWQLVENYFEHYIGRPSPLWRAERLTAALGGATLWFKRDELNHTGAHKINHCIGQVLLARRMGKTRVIAETGAGQHGVAVATVCALFDLPCVVYMGAKDIQRQKPNLFRMRLLGAEVRPVSAGSASLKDALNEALRDWIANVDSTFYIIGTAAGPHPYPVMVRDFQSVIGREVRRQFTAQSGRALPDGLIAAIGGGSNALGLFHAFLDEPSVRLFGVEAGGTGLASDRHAASLNGGRAGILHGNRTYVLQDDEGQVKEAHSISAGLDYPAVGPEHAWLFEQKRVQYVVANDSEALEAFRLCCRTEGILPALEPAHALAYACQLAPAYSRETHFILNLCGRGDKDIFTVASALGVDLGVDPGVDLGVGGDIEANAAEEKAAAPPLDSPHVP